MNKAKIILIKLIHPPRLVVYITSVVVFTMLIYIFVTEKTESMLAYIIYFMSAYSLIICIVYISKLFCKLKSNILEWKILKKIFATKSVNRYKIDIYFRGSVSLYQGMIVNFLYVLFRIIVGIRYASAWFISMAIYYFILGVLRTYLIYKYNNRILDDLNYEYQCYCYIARMLFLLNIPMGGMIILMIKTEASFSYPGYIIYLSAIYTFYIMILSIINIIKFKQAGSPILLAGKVLNFISALMSILGLQTAMISLVYLSSFSFFSSCWRCSWRFCSCFFQKFSDHDGVFF